MPDHRELSIRASTDEVSPTDSVVIYNERIVHRYSALLQALHTSSGTTRSVSGSGGQKLTWSDEDNPDAPPYDVEAADAADAKADLELERRAFMMLVGDHKPDEKYGVRRIISTGGMGRLYYVHDSDFERDTAMKVVLPELKNDTSMLRSFIREARITAQLEHPNIIPVHDLGYLPEYGIYFTMKYVDGESLHDILLKLETGDPDYLKLYDYVMLLNIFRKVCDAVAFAHSRGVLHRDIKPHNIMVGAYGEVLLMDWGLARAEPNRQRTQDTSSHQYEFDDIEEIPGDDQVIKGSPGYMSPEQAEGLNEQLDERSDVFLLGATLYHMFTFFPPYLGSTIMDVLESAIACDYLPPETVAFGGLDIPDEVCRIMQKAMAPRPADRYGSVPDLITDLDDLLHGRMQSERRSFRAGEALMWEGEMGHECYIITEGEVEIFKLNDLGEKIVLGRQSKGEIVGEMALITHEPRSASVIAISDTEVTVLTEVTFEKNLDKLPAWMSRTIQSMAHRLSVTNSRLTDTHTQLTRDDVNPPS